MTSQVITNAPEGYYVEELHQMDTTMDMLSLIGRHGVGHQSLIEDAKDIVASYMKAWLDETARPQE